MAKKLTLVVADQVYQTLREIAAASEDTLSGAVSTSIRALDWILRQEREGYSVRAEKEEKDKVVIKELVIS